MKSATLTSIISRLCAEAINGISRESGKNIRLINNTTKHWVQPYEGKQFTRKSPPQHASPSFGILHNASLTGNCGLSVPRYAKRSMFPSIVGLVWVPPCDSLVTTAKVSDGHRFVPCWLRQAGSLRSLSVTRDLFTMGNVATSPETVVATKAEAMRRKLSDSPDRAYFPWLHQLRHLKSSASSQ